MSARRSVLRLKLRLWASDKVNKKDTKYPNMPNSPSTLASKLSNLILGIDSRALIPVLTSAL